MIDYTYRNLFHQSSIDKQWTITDGEITLTNSDIYSEQVELNESICSENNIVFGSCESNTLSFTTSCLTQMLGRRLEVSMVLEGHDDEPFVVGTFTVIEDELTSDRRKRQVRAYDDLYFINNANVAEWYNGLTFPLTLKQFRDSFFTNFNITQETTTLPNDSMTIEKTVEAEVLSGATVIQSICELNGRCGHIDREGVFRYLPIYIGGNGLYPSLTLYPSNRLFPSENAEGGQVTPMEVEEYEKIEYADYEVKSIDKLQIRQEENDVGAIVGTGDNSYIVEDNFLVYGKDAEALEDVATNMFGEINRIKYTPSNVVCVADPCVEVGDMLRIYKTDGTRLYAYVLSRTIKGLQNLKDNISCKGTEYQEEEVNGLNTEIIQLKGKTTKISKTVDGFEVEVLDTTNPNSLASKISQNTTDIEAKVSETYGDSSSAFSWVLKSTGFDVKNNGTSVFKVNSSGAEINGKVTAKSGYIGNGSQGFTIGDKAIYNGITAMTDNTHNGIYVGTDGIKLNGPAEWMELRSGNTRAQLYGPYFQLQDFDDKYTMKIDNSWITLQKEVSSGVFKDCFQLGDLYSNNIPIFAICNRSTGTEKWATLRGDELIIDKIHVGSQILTNGNIIAYGNLTVSGSKNRAVKTKDYGTRCLGAYETASPYFGDIGEGQLDESGNCTIQLDPIFLETVNTTLPYQVFLQEYGDGKCWVEERNETNFVIKGTPNMRFAYEIKARQLGFENTRLEELELPKIEEVNNDGNKLSKDSME